MANRTTFSLQMRSNVAKIIRDTIKDLDAANKEVAFLSEQLEKLDSTDANVEINIGEINAAVKALRELKKEGGGVEKTSAKMTRSMKAVSTQAKKSVAEMDAMLQTAFQVSKFKAFSSQQKSMQDTVAKASAAMAQQTGAAQNLARELEALQRIGQKASSGIHSTVTAAGERAAAGPRGFKAASQQWQRMYSEPRRKAAPPAPEPPVAPQLPPALSPQMREGIADIVRGVLPELEAASKEAQLLMEELTKLESGDLSLAVDLSGIRDIVEAVEQIKEGGDSAAAMGADMARNMNAVARFTQKNTTYLTEQSDILSAVNRKLAQRAALMGDVNAADSAGVDPMQGGGAQGRGQGRAGASRGAGQAGLTAFEEFEQRLTLDEADLIAEGKRAAQLLALGVKGGAAANVSVLADGFQKWVSEIKGVPEDTIAGLFPPELYSRAINLLDTLEEVGGGVNDLNAFFEQTPGVLARVNKQFENARATMDRQEETGGTVLRLFERLVDETEDVAFAQKNLERALGLVSAGIDDASGAATKLAAIRRGEVRVLADLGPRYEVYIDALEKLPLAQRRAFANRIMDRALNDQKKGVNNLSDILPGISGRIGLLGAQFEEFKYTLGPLPAILGGIAKATIGVGVAMGAVFVGAVLKGQSALQEFSLTAREASEATGSRFNQVFASFYQAMQGGQPGSFETALSRMFENAIPIAEGLGTIISDTFGSEQMQEYFVLLNEILNIFNPIFAIVGAIGQKFLEVAGVTEDINSKFKGLSGLMEGSLFLTNSFLKAMTLMLSPVQLVMRLVTETYNLMVKAAEFPMKVGARSVAFGMHVRAALFGDDADHQEVEARVARTFQRLEGIVDGLQLDFADDVLGFSKEGIVKATDFMQQAFRGTFEIIRDDAERVLGDLAEDLSLRASVASAGRQAVLQAATLGGMDNFQSTMQAALMAQRDAAQVRADAKKVLDAAIDEYQDQVKASLTPEDRKALTLEYAKQVALADAQVREANRLVAALDRVKQNYLDIEAARDELTKTSQLIEADKARLSLARQIAKTSSDAAAEAETAAREELGFLQRKLEAVEKAEAAVNKQLQNLAASGAQALPGNQKFRETLIVQDEDLKRQRDELIAAIKQQTLAVMLNNEAVTILGRLEEIRSRKFQDTANIPGTLDALRGRRRELQSEERTTQARLEFAAQQLIDERKALKAPTAMSPMLLAPLMAPLMAPFFAAQEQKSYKAFRDALKEAERARTGASLQNEKIDKAIAFLERLGRRDVTFEQYKRSEEEVKAQADLPSGLARQRITEARMKAVFAGFEQRQAAEAVQAAKAAQMPAAVIDALVSKQDEAAQKFSEAVEEFDNAVKAAPKADKERVTKASIQSGLIAVQAVAQPLQTFLEDIQGTGDGDIRRRFDLMVEGLENSISDVTGAIGQTIAAGIGEGTGGPIGAVVGGLIGATIEGLIATNEERRQRREAKEQERNEERRRHEELVRRLHQESLRAMRENLRVNEGIYDNTSAFLEGQRRVENVTVAAGGVDDRAVRGIVRNQDEERRIYD